MFEKDGPSLWELTRQALSSTEKGYDLLAPKFDATPFRTPDAVVLPTLEHLQQTAPIHTALDLCCGTGASLVPLKAICKDRLVGVDFSQGMLDQARAHLDAAEGEAQVELVKADLFSLTYENAFDLAVCFGGLGHIENKHEAAFLSMVHRALRPGGRFALITSPMPPRLSAAYLLSKGFNLVMRVRNALIRPPFIMYYLTFMLPKIQTRLEQHGFSVTVVENVFPAPWTPLKLVIAQKKTVG